MNSSLHYCLYYKQTTRRDLPSKSSLQSGDNRYYYFNLGMTVPPLSRPLGLDALHAACRALYPNQANPLQVTALVKYW